MYALLLLVVETAASGDVTGNRPVSAYCAQGDPVANKLARCVCQTCFSSVIVQLALLIFELLIRLC